MTKPAGKVKLGLQEALRLAHTVDIKVRVEGKDYWYEGDFLKEVYNLQARVAEQGRRALKESSK